MVPSQLHPIFRLARRGNPYKVVPLQSQDFLDFKQLSKDLRILKEREIEGSTDFVLDWKQMAEIKITKQNLHEMQFKISHNEESYQKLLLKRQKVNLSKIKVAKLNSTALNITKAKYNDMLSLCQGSTPVIRSKEHKQFYELPPYKND